MLLNIIYDKLFLSLKEDYSSYNDDELEKYLKDNYEIRTFFQKENCYSFIKIDNKVLKNLLNCY
ncbi:hypothetical protein [Candidatus Phytoplasma tritici]|uniref:hypothetical protein n=1 Tax=Candidatus Phytoplasma tritici TaxID=321961 RepID=UPI00040DC937|nr:hypothetical protein [Candidatus Phytoplasma tritici]